MASMEGSMDCRGARPHAEVSERTVAWGSHQSVLQEEAIKQCFGGRSSALQLGQNTRLCGSPSTKACSACA